MIDRYFRHVLGIPGRAGIALLLVAITTNPVLAGPEPSSGTAPDPRQSVLGAVSDMSGLPLIGAFVAAVEVGREGPAAIAVTDTKGQFALSNLAPGVYTLVAASLGFVGGVLQGITVPRMEPVSLRLQVQTSRSLSSVHAPLDLGWAHRSKARDILRQTETVVAAGDDAPAGAVPPTGWTPGSEPTTNFGGAAFGELELWTLTSNSEEGLGSGATTLALGSRATGGSSEGWRLEAHLTERGSIWAHTDITHDLGRDHSLEVGLGYFGHHPRFGDVAGEMESSPWVGSVYARDRWDLASPVTLAYGVRFEHHNYLSEVGLVSPSFELTYEPAESLRLITGISYNTSALGVDTAEPAVDSYPLFGQNGLRIVTGDDLMPERALRYHLGLERRLGTAGLRIKAFYDHVSDELLGVYVSDSAGAQDYFLVNLGDSVVRGFEIALAGTFLHRFTGEVSYVYGSREGEPVPAAGVAGRGLTDRGALISAARQLATTHELQAVLGTVLGRLRTKVRAVYYWKQGAPVLKDGELKHDYGRFDLRLRQPLPFRALDSEWSALVDVRNLIGSEYEGLANVSLSDLANLSRVFAGGLAIRF